MTSKTKITEAEKDSNRDLTRRCITDHLEHFDHNNNMEDATDPNIGL